MRYPWLLLRQCLQFDPPDRTVLIRWVISGYPPTASPEAAAAKRRERLVGCHRVPFPCSEMPGPSRRGGLVGVMRRTCLLLRADFFAFRFVSDLRARQYIESIEQIFTDRSSETKWPLRPKRNGPLKRAGKPPERSRRNLRDTGGEKKCQESRHGQRQKKPSRDGTRSGPARSPGIGRLPPDVPVP